MTSLLPSGTALGDGRYVLGAVLGQGGFGVTYSGEEAGTGCRVAVKEYFPTRCSRRSGDGVTVEPLPGMEEIYEGGRFSFLKEARVLSELEGMPSVVQALAYLEENNTAYLVMEYLDGTPLHQLMAREPAKRLSPETLFPPLKRLLHDISLLHERKVIHRDIAPDNIMWMSDGTLKLLDFGSARSTEGGKAMTVMLKHSFAPVEQYQSHGQGAYTDIYAMAATIYYCLTGVVPAQASERAMALQNGSPDPLKPPTALGAALTPEEESSLLWGLEVLPQKRPQTMGEFAERLFPEPPDVTSDSGTPPMASRAFDAARGWIRTHPVPVICAAVVFLAFTAGAVLFWVYVLRNL